MQEKCDIINNIFIVNTDFLLIKNFLFVVYFPIPFFYLNEFKNFLLLE